MSRQTGSNHKSATNIFEIRNNVQIIVDQSQKVADHKNMNYSAYPFKQQDKQKITFKTEQKFIMQQPEQTQQAQIPPPTASQKKFRRSFSR